jgi:hypothetical protein
MANLIEAGAIAPAQLTGKTWRIKVLEGDRKGASAYYPKEALQEGAHLFAKGTRIYADHPTKDEAFNRPARSVRDIVGYLSEDATFDGKDLYANATFFPEHQDFIRTRAEAGVIGMSIRASGELTEAHGLKTLVKFTNVQSVDVVTVPGAGGGFTTLLESEQASVSESDAESQKKEEILMEKELAEALDALVADTKSNATAIAGLTDAVTALVAEAAKTAKAKAEDAKDGGADDDEEDADGNVIKGKKKPSVKPTVKESASFADIDAALTEAALPAPSRKSVFAAVEAGIDLAEAVADEKAKVEAILESAHRSFAGFVSDDGKEVSVEEALSQAGKLVYG